MTGMPFLVELVSEPVPVPALARVQRIALDSRHREFGHGSLRMAFSKACGHSVILGRLRAVSDQRVVLDSLFRSRPAAVWWQACGAGLTRVERHGDQIVAVEGPVPLPDVLRRLGA